MALKEHLAFMLNTNLGALKKQLDDVTEEESMEQGRDGIPHIRWQAGHLVHTCGWAAGLLSGDLQYKQSDEYKKRFGGGSEVSPDPQTYPPLSQLRAELYEALEKASAAAGQLSDEQLEANVPEETGFTSTIANAVEFLCMHAFYHAGQITQLRKVLGRERPFG